MMIRNFQGYCWDQTHQCMGKCFINCEVLLNTSYLGYYFFLDYVLYTQDYQEDYNEHFAQLISSRKQEWPYEKERKSSCFNSPDAKKKQRNSFGWMIKVSRDSLFSNLAYFWAIKNMSQRWFMFNYKASLREDKSSPCGERLPFIWAVPASTQHRFLMSGPELGTLGILPQKRDNFCPQRIQIQQ